MHHMQVHHMQVHHMQVHHMQVYHMRTSHAGDLHTSHAGAQCQQHHHVLYDNHNRQCQKQCESPVAGSIIHTHMQGTAEWTSAVGRTVQVVMDTSHVSPVCAMPNALHKQYTHTNSNGISDEHLLADCRNICAATEKQMHHFRMALCASIHQRSCTLCKDVGKGFPINLLKILPLSAFFVAVSVTS